MTPFLLTLASILSRIRKPTPNFELVDEFGDLIVTEDGDTIRVD